ncbi:LysM peptidoglycan-binding domain-containing protein [Nocardioides panacisoli]|uniref:LysM domain-containing protein n=1 Tax=Nocardioides panacisoli TaxID=627624 RepID=A0ABP7IU47_9ACTN
MSICSRSRSVARPCLVWLTVTAAVGALVQVTTPVLVAPAPRDDFAGLLVAGCAAAALAAAGWLWLVTTSVVLEVVRDRHAARPSAGALRRLVLAACGVAVLTGTAAPAGAAPHPVSPLDGLPLPDRAVGTAAPHRLAPAPAETGRPATVRVRPGDSLWLIAERALGPRATDARVAAYWRRIQARNAAVIGDDPDLIRPDQRLQLPPTHQE